MHKKIFYLTTMLIVVFFIPKIVSANVVINEVYYDPKGTDTGKEYIILYNNGDSDINLTGWDLDCSSAPYYTLPAFILSGKNSVIIHVNASGENTNDNLYTGETSNMSNTKGPVALFNSTTHSEENLIDYIEYGASEQTNESKAISAGIWSAGDFIPDADEGRSIKLKNNGTDNNSSDDWTPSLPTIVSETETEGETEDTTESETGQSESESTTDEQALTADAGENIIAFIGQEINFDGSKSSDPNENEIAYFWNMGNGELIEECQHFYSYRYPGTYLVTLTVYNGLTYSHDTITIKIEAQKITINEFIPNPESDDEENEWIEIYNDSDSIVDISNWQLDDDEGGSSPFIFPENTLIAPKNYLVFSRKITKIALNNDYDKVRLLLPEGMVFQEIEYQDPKQGQSSAFVEQGFVWSVPTPGMPNINNLAIGGNNEIEDFSYDYQTQTYQTQESNQDYSWYYNPPQEQSQGGFIDLSQQYYYNQKEQDNSEEKNELAAVFQEEIDAFSNNSDLAQKQNKSTENLVVLIFLVILGALIIGILVTKIIKKTP